MVSLRGIPKVCNYEIVKSGRTVADGCKIIVSLFKMYNGKAKILNCKIKLFKSSYMYINHSRGVDYVIQCRADSNKYRYKCK
jgi:hypothetical protein